MNYSNPTTPSLELSFGSAIHAAREAIVIIDEQQRIVLFNPAAQRTFECDEASAIGSELSRFIPERYRQAHLAHVRSFDGPCPAERSMLGRTTVRGLRANGEEFPAQVTITRAEVPGDAGPRRYFTALVHDLSREHLLQAEIDTLTGRMHAVFDLAPTAIWVTDGDSIVYANPVCAELLACPDRHALIGKSIYAMLHPHSHSRVRQHMSEVWENNAPVSLVHERLARLDGSHCDVDIAMAALPCHERTVLQMVITDISQRTQERLLLERSRQELRNLSAKLVDLREAERRHIARELHDELGQRLSLIKMELTSLTKAQQRAKEDRISEMLEMVDDTVAAVRRIATDLRPMMLDDLGLSAALEWLTHESERRMGIRIELKLDEQALPTSEPGSITIFRIVQEALTNVARHAHASHVLIEVKRHGDGLALTIEDNGIGFSDRSRGKKGSLGLIGIRERVGLLGGDLEIGNAASGGGRIIVTMPMEPPTADPDAARGHQPRSVPTTDAIPSLGAAVLRPRRPAIQKPSLDELTHELRVHQVELEMQNEELRRTQVELVAARDRYVDLYDFAPVGYFTLDALGQVTEANLTGATLLGRNRAALMGRSLARCVAAIDSDRWQRHLTHALQNDGAHRIELKLRSGGGGVFDGQIDCLCLRRPGSDPSLRITLTDISQRRLAEMDRRVAVNVVDSSEAERRRVARELHEELGQRLSSLKMNLSALQQPDDRRRPDGHVTEMMELIDTSLATVRRIATELRPLMLDDLGLNAALDWLARESTRLSGVPVTISVGDTDPPLAEVRAVGLFRLAQAALADVLNHAPGQGAHIELKHQDGDVVLVVQANGSGWPIVPLHARPDASDALRDQAHLLGGELTIDAVPGICRKVTFHLSPA
ncbi:MAG: PAS domain S-box protein [Burkholderiaceae bacterium]|nr:PAS domain S-box protein [Burkholderiaceae bacterium]